MTKSTLETLHNCGSHQIVHKTVFLAGATSFNEKTEQPKWNEEIFGSTISGQISNVYSESDHILRLYILATWKSPIGRNVIFDQMPFNKDNFILKPNERVRDSAVDRYP